MGSRFSRNTSSSVDNVRNIFRGMVEGSSKRRKVLIISKFYVLRQLVKRVPIFKYFDKLHRFAKFHGFVLAILISLTYLLPNVWSVISRLLQRQMLTRKQLPRRTDMLLSDTVNRPCVSHYNWRRVPQTRSLEFLQETRAYSVDYLRDFSSHYLLRHGSAPYPFQGSFFIMDFTACSGNFLPQYGTTIAYPLNRLKS